MILITFLISISFKQAPIISKKTLRILFFINKVASRRLEGKHV